jgi:signal transduction histidine kinase
MTERRAAQAAPSDARAEGRDVEESGTSVGRLGALVELACLVRDADDARARLLRGAAEALAMDGSMVLDPAGVPELAQRCRDAPAVVRDLRRDRAARVSELSTRQARCAILASIPGDGILAAWSREARPLGPDELAIARAAAHLIGAAAARPVEAREEGRARFLAVVAHDLRSPVTAISMVAESLLRAPPYALVEGRVRDAARRIQRGARRMSALLADLLDFERIRLGGLELEVGEHELSGILEDVLEIMRPLAESKGIELSARASGGETLLPCDRGRLAQLLSNLVQNAIKYTPPRGSITLTADALDDGARFAVQDTGRGIGESALTRIFDPYWQARQGDGGGVGLGLAIAAGIAEAHGSRIEVASRLGEGSVFSILLPWQSSGSGRFSVRAGPSEAPS